MIFDRFELIVVPFPFVDSPRTRPRPALVLSNRHFNRANGHTVLAMVTRATHTRWPSDHAIEDLAPTGLRDPSVVRFKVFTLDNRILQRGIGRLGNADARACSTTLRATFGERTRPFAQADQRST
jgi:mRNA interferase MazF